jgi:DNA-binding transcriptional MerR regulator
MLTIGQLASHAGVTVRTVRHYHAKGLLPEPERDYSGYRRYDAQAVVTLIRIRTLADAGVPLSRVRELLAADPEQFAAAVHDMDRRLRSQIRELGRHRDRIAQLAAGDSLALPPEAVAYFGRMRELGIPERVIEVERDSWIMIAAQVPEQVPALMALKRLQIEDGKWRDLYRDLGEIVDSEPDDPRLPEVADRVVTFLEAVVAEAKRDQEATEVLEEAPLGDDLIELLDSAFLESFSCAPRLLRLIEERGWTGWTMIERVESAQPAASHVPG